jgi:hypothetical protein
MALAVFDRVLSGVFSACRNVFPRAQSEDNTVIFHVNLDVEILVEKWFNGLMELLGYVYGQTRVPVGAFGSQVVFL